MKELQTSSEPTMHPAHRNQINTDASHFVKTKIQDTSVHDSKQTRSERNDKICRICTKELSGAEYDKLIRNHINQIPEELRTPDEAFQLRLKTCSECEYIRCGMCRMCGCFVEIKASRINARCPLVPQKWLL